MDNNSLVPLKIYLISRDSSEPEIRRFGLLASVITSYNLLMARITEIFPRLSDQAFTLCWKDEEGDQVAISSDEELIIALTSMKSDLKTFYVKIKSQLHNAVENESSVLHPGVYCDGCNCNIAGFRFKCLECKDFDLCSLCERTGVHAEHPMLRFASRFSDDQIRKLRKIAYGMQPLSVVEVKRSRRRHSHDGGRSEFGRKKKRCDRRESGPETGDESEDGYYKKCRNSRKCNVGKECANGYERKGINYWVLSSPGPYSRMIDVINYLNPIKFQLRQPCETTGNATEKSNEDCADISYLQSVGSSLQKLLDPLGINVEFEVRPRSEKCEEKKKEEKKGEQTNEEKSSEFTPSAPFQKEVNFTSDKQMRNEVKQKVDEITNMLANQRMSKSNSADNDDWVSFEELKKNSEESRGSPSADNIPKEFDLEANSEGKGAESSNQQLYPNLTSSSYVSLNPKVNIALEKMLAMGFTNEKNWLTFLLEAKDGNIDEALEVLSFQKKN